MSHEKGIQCVIRKGYYSFLSQENGYTVCYKKRVYYDTGKGYTVFHKKTLLLCGT